MISKEVWLDKIPSDKAGYFNRLKMSIDLFARKMELSAYNIEMLMHEEGYTYIDNERKFIKTSEYKGRLFHVL